ncbi:MAG TPA: STT3 domain-containing protein [Candidatus Omnitrophota bacterium]|nr:hypothetical protein [Candidatus Omnitrophota bacterium]HNQ50631.1 STT3 domain-containing protein [Candidatus Omnitrophota bacterium]HQO37663.1 STT3 domain-containing protein [Candidatus Omnitrophota bacterium]
MHKRYPYIPLLGLGLAIGINVFFRSFPVNFPQLAGEARSRVESRLYQRSAELINRNYSNLSSMARESLVNVAVKEYAAQNKSKLVLEAADEYARLKDRFQDRAGQTYLFELDCWHWARYVENTVLTGQPGDTVINGRQWDTFMNHPDGIAVSYNMLVYYVSAFLYRTANLVMPMRLHAFLFYLPLLFIIVFLGILYLVCWRFYGAIAAFVCTMFVGCAPIFLPRSCAGWFDMDILNQLFPLLVVFSYLMSYGRVRPVARFVWLGVSALCVGLFAYTWVYWWFVVVIVLAYEAYSLLDRLCEKLQYKAAVGAQVRRHLATLGFYLPACAIAVFVLCGPDPLRVLARQAMSALTLNEPISASIWPNVFSTVGELTKPSFMQIANFSGGTVLFLVSLCCMLAVVLRNKRYRGAKRESIFMFVLWFTIIFAICYKGTRLIVFLLIPMGIFLGWGAREAWAYAMRRRRKKWYFVPAAIVLFVSLTGTCVWNGHRVAKGLYPMMNDSWYKLLTNIRQNTPDDAVLNSWWDFGDWFKTVAGRRVIFDGQSQDSPRAYWMAKILKADSEEYAMRILRMLNNGGNRAFDVIQAHVKDPFGSLLLLEQVLAVDPVQAERILARALPLPTIEELRPLLFGTPQSAYFIVDHTLAAKMHPISYLGNWDVLRLYIVKNIDRKSKEDICAQLSLFGVEKTKAETLYSDARLLHPAQYRQWISHHARFVTGAIPGRRQGDIVLFDNGLVYDPKDRSLFVFNAYDGKYLVPQSLFYAEDGLLKEHVYQKSNLPFSALLLEDGDAFRIIEVDRELAGSLFARLYFLRGRGLRYFKPYTDNNDEQNHIGVFEIDWTADEQ